MIMRRSKMIYFSFVGDNTNDDWEAAFKYLMKSNNMGSNTKSQYEDHQQQEEWLRLQEMRKHTALNNGLGMNQFNMFNGNYLGLMEIDVNYLLKLIL